MAVAGAPPSDPTDRERWESDCRFRERELQRSEAETEIKRKEVELRGVELGRSRYANPVFIAVVAAAIAAAGNAYVAFTNGQSQRDLEDRKSEQARIQEMIKTGDPDTAAKNLQFLLDAGLLRDPDTVAALKKYLAARAPGSGAALPPESGAPGIIGADDTVPLESLPTGTPLANVARGVGRVRQYSGNVMRTQCTAVHVGQGAVIVPGFCVSGGGNDARFGFVVKLGAIERTVPAKLRGPPITASGDEVLGFAVLDVPVMLDAPALKLATASPKVGEPLSMILYRNDEPRVISSAADCRVTVVETAAVGHLCDTGTGSSGAPLLNSANEVVGLHLMRSNPPDAPYARALRGDWIASRIGR